MKITLELSKVQYETLIEALETYGRLLMGQTSIVGEALTRNGKSSKDNELSKDALVSVAQLHFDRINGYNSHLGIANAPRKGQIALEMHSWLRYKSGKELPHSIYNQEPMNFSGENYSLTIEQKQIDTKK